MACVLPVLVPEGPIAAATTAARVASTAASALRMLRDVRDSFSMESSFIESANSSAATRAAAAAAIKASELATLASASFSDCFAASDGPSSRFGASTMGCDDLLPPLLLRSSCSMLDGDSVLWYRTMSSDESEDSSISVSTLGARAVTESMLAVVVAAVTGAVAAVVAAWPAVA